MNSVAIVTCATRDDSGTADARLMDACAKVGLLASPMIWNDPAVEWQRFDACLVRTPWDWVENPLGFSQWIDVRGQDSFLLNPPETLQWGYEKTYLLALAAAGLPIIPTLLMDSPDTARVLAWARRQGWERLAIKPSLSAGSIGVSIVPATERDVAASLNRPWPSMGALLVQPYQAAIETAGETSLIFIDGQYSHCVRKQPKSGDFRVQPQYGARLSACAPLPEQQALAQAVMDLVPGNWILGRVDMVQDEKDSWRIIECEVVEPDLYFGHDDQAADRLALALKQRLADKRIAP